MEILVRYFVVPEKPGITHGHKGTRLNSSHNPTSQPDEVAVHRNAKLITENLKHFPKDGVAVSVAKFLGGMSLC